MQSQIRKVNLTLNSLYEIGVDEAFITNLIARKELFFSDFKDRVIGYTESNYPFLFLPLDLVSTTIKRKQYECVIVEVKMTGASTYILLEIDKEEGTKLDNLMLQPDTLLDKNLYYRWVSPSSISVSEILIRG